MIHIKADSQEGMQMLMDFARIGGYVLNEAHKSCAEKWGVDTSGVIFSRKIPLQQNNPLKIFNSSTYGRLTTLTKPSNT